MIERVVGKIDLLPYLPGQPATFFGEPMVGITVKQFDEYRELKARAAEICTWNRIPEAGDMDDLYETACEQEFQWLGSDTSGLKFCWNCGRKVEVKP
jgi:hypothetical protein